MQEKIILKSISRDYPDLEVNCKVILNNEINKYIESIPNDKKFIVYKSSLVSAREGILKERIRNKVKTIINGRGYIISDKKTIVKKRHSVVKSVCDGMTIVGLKPMLDIVYINLSLDEHEEFVCSYNEFCEDYQVIRDCGLQNGYVEEGELYVPTFAPKDCIQLEEDIIFETADGEYEVGLAGNYLIYNIEDKKYKVVEKDLFNKTYTKEEGKVKRLKGN